MMARCSKNEPTSVIILSGINEYDPGDMSVNDHGGAKKAMMAFINNETGDGIARSIGRKLFQKIEQLEKLGPLDKLGSTEYRVWAYAIIYCEMFAIHYDEYNRAVRDFHLALRDLVLNDKEQLLPAFREAKKKKAAAEKQYRQTAAEVATFSENLNSILSRKERGI